MPRLREGVAHSTDQKFVTVVGRDRSRPWPAISRRGHGTSLAKRSRGELARARAQLPHADSRDPEGLAVAQDLAEAEPKLLFLVVVRDALDLGDEDCSPTSQARSKFGSRGCLDRGSIPACRSTRASSF